MASAIRNLTERRVPQVLAIYLGAAFGVVQFVDFVGSRYLLPAVWTDLALLAMAILLPSVLLYTYHHGRPGRDEWQRSEKIFIPVNLAVLFALVGFVGAGAPLTPTSKRITVTDEQGNKREAVVANKAYRKRVAMFMFDSPADTAVQWLQFGLPQMAVEDLQQSNFLEAMPSIYMRNTLQQKGYAKGVNVPLSLKRDVVNELHVPYFVTGKIEKAGAEYVATVQIYETESAKLVRERVYRGDYPARLGDQISEGLLKDLQVPELSDREPNMPVSEILSTNPQALRSYLEGMSAIYVDTDWPKAMASATEAVRIDPGFASAHFMKFILGRLANQPQIAVPAIKASLDHSYRLPERMREVVKANYYIAKEDWPRSYAVCEMLAQIYPEDIQIQLMLLQMNSLRDDKAALITSLKKVLELDPTRSDLVLQLGLVHEARGETKEALAQYHKYAAKFPTDPRGHRAIGTLNRRIGELGQAKASFEKALLIKPEDHETLINLARVHLVEGDFAVAEEKLDEAAAVARTPQEQAGVHGAVFNMKAFRGDIRGALESANAYFGVLSKVMPNLVVVADPINLQLPRLLARVDAPMAKRKIDELRKQLTEPPGSYSLTGAEVPYFIEIGDATAAQSALARMDAVIKQNSWNYLASESAHGHGRLEELRGDCQRALQFYRETDRLEPTRTDINTDIGRCLRKLGRIKDAEAELMKTLRNMPAHGETNLELGLLYKDAGDAAKARAHLQRSLRTWANADPNFKPARSAREALSALK